MNHPDAKTWFKLINIYIVKGVTWYNFFELCMYVPVLDYELLFMKEIENYYFDFSLLFLGRNEFLPLRVRQLQVKKLATPGKVN